MDILKIEEIEQLANSIQVDAVPEKKPEVQNPALLLYSYTDLALGNVNRAIAAASAGKGGKLGDASPLPSPPGLPSSGAPNPTVDSGSSTNYWGTGYLDKLAQLITYMDQNPNDPGAVFNLIQYIANLAQAGDMTSDVVNLLNQANVTDQIQIGIGMMMELAFFNGGGQQGALSYLNALKSALSGYPQSDPFVQSMESAVNFQINQLPFFVTQHVADGTNPPGIPKGDLYWNYNGVIYDWSSGGKTDQTIIMQIIANQGFTGDPNPYFGSDGLNLNAFLQQYRMEGLDELLKEFAGHPEIAICLWMMTVYDNQFQGQQQGLASSTNLLSSLTNNYATPLLELAQKIGSLSDSDAAQFRQLFFNANNLIGMESQTSTIAGDWTNNVFNMVGGITGLNFNVTIGGQSVPVGSSVTLLQVLTGQTVTWQDSKGNSVTYTFTSHDITQALNGFYVSAPSGQSTSPSTNPGYQTIVDALQQGGSLITGTSKTLATQLSTVANTDNEVVKFGHSVVDPTGGGLVQMENKVIDNQVSH